MRQPHNHEARIMKLNTSAAIAVLLAPFLLTGCGSENSETMLASAKSYLAKNDNKAAIIQIKNALQVNPDLPEARYLLGNSLLESGNANSAELELRKALALKYSNDLVVPKLAAAMLAQGQTKKMVDEFSGARLSAPAATAELQTTLAVAYVVLGKGESAEAALKAALAAQPGHVPALLAQARLKAGSRDFDGAFLTVDKIIGLAPKSADAWKLKGDLFVVAKDDSVRALEAYRKAIEIKSQFLPAYFAAVGVLLRQENTDEAKKQWDELKKVSPNSFQTKYLETYIAYLKKDTKLARELCQQIIKVQPENPEVLQLAGSVELQDNSLGQAESYLTRATQIAPNLAFARKLLLVTYLRSGQSAKALTALNSTQGKDNIPPDQYSIAGEIYLQNGDFKKSEEYFVKASKLDPGDPKKRTAVALAKLVGGQAVPAFDELKEISASDTGTSADLTLISVYLKRGEFNKALLAIDALERKEPGKPLAATLRGRTQLAIRDAAGARKSFERALEISPGFFAAASSLSAMDLAEKKPAEAKRRMEAIVAKEPSNGQAILVLAEIAVASGAGNDEVEKILKRAVTVSPSDIAPRLALVNVYLHSKDFKQATAAALDAVSVLPENPNAMAALGQVQQASGETNQAIGTYAKLATLLPNSPQPYMRLASLYIAAKNKEATERNLRKALELKPDLSDAQVVLSQLMVADKRYAESLSLARKVQEQRPKEATGYLLEGDISVAQKDWVAAIRAYRAGFKQVPSPYMAVKLHDLLLVGGKSSEAEVFSNDWRKAHPDDSLFLFHLGDSALIRKDYPVAKVNFLALTKLLPNNAAAFNNLAWAENQLNGEDALKYAEVANKISPNQPAFMDTLATILASRKEFEKAIIVQRDVVKLSPENPGFRMSLAKIYIQSGDKLNAKQELDRLVALGDKFPGRAEVASMLSGL